MGHAVQAYATAADGLAAMERSRFDLLFSDVVLGGDINGPRLAAEARARQTDIAVLLTTGYAGDALADADARDVVLPKPYSADDLAAKIGEAMRASGPARTHRVLLVEDETLVAMVAVDILTDAGFEVTDVATGRAALSALTAAAPYDAAVIDLGLPDMNGLELLAEIRRLHPGLPVIVASGRGALLDAEGGVPGAASLVDKPYSASDLVSAVRRCIANA